MANPNFVATMSSNEIWRDLDDTRCITDDLDAIEADIATLETDKADADHAHTGYAPSEHTHSGYAESVHGHSYNDLSDKPTIPTYPELISGTEYLTAERFNNKPVYIKQISCGAMPSSNATKNVYHNAENVEYIVDFGGCMTVDGTGAISLPYYFSSSNRAYLSVTNTDFVIISGSNNLSGYTDVRVWFKYTKTTD